ncbi:MAG: DUF5053 domain-containing protein [Paludibacter sp.]|nr:DUF5053 domain-containing protein [Paludibacter sp.]
MSTSVLEKEVPTSTLIRDISVEVTWSKIAQRYFPDKSIPWFYNKLRGVDGNGGAGDFDYSERLQLRDALYDFAERIRTVAKNLE